MNLCKTCGTICPFDDEHEECDAYSPRTNEQWFCKLPTSEKAKVLSNATYSSAMMGAEITALPKEDEVRKWEMWLKQPHREEREK